MLKDREIFLLLVGVIFFGWLAGGLERGLDPSDGYTIDAPEVVFGDTSDREIGGCAISGCSSQLCIDAEKANEFVTTCEYREEYACYQKTRCMRLETGECGWEKTEKLRSCVIEAQDKN